jgi:hypothetical protein
VNQHKKHEHKTVIPSPSFSSVHASSATIQPPIDFPTSHHIELKMNKKKSFVSAHMKNFRLQQILEKRNHPPHHIEKKVDDFCHHELNSSLEREIHDEKQTDHVPLLPSNEINRVIHNCRFNNPVKSSSDMKTTNSGDEYNNNETIISTTANDSLACHMESFRNHQQHSNHNIVSFDSQISAIEQKQQTHNNFDHSNDVFNTSNTNNEMKKMRGTMQPTQTSSLYISPLLGAQQKRQHHDASHYDGDGVTGMLIQQPNQQDLKSYHIDNNMKLLSHNLVNHEMSSEQLFFLKTSPPVGTKHHVYDESVVTNNNNKQATSFSLTSLNNSFLLPPQQLQQMQEEGGKNQNNYTMFPNHHSCMNNIIDSSQHYDFSHNNECSSDTSTNNHNLNHANNDGLLLHNPDNTVSFSFYNSMIRDTTSSSAVASSTLAVEGLHSSQQLQTPPTLNTNQMNSATFDQLNMLFWNQIKEQQHQQHNSSVLDSSGIVVPHSNHFDQYTNAFEQEPTTEAAKSRTTINNNTNDNDNNIFISRPHMPSLSSSVADSTTITTQKGQQQHNNLHPNDFNQRNNLFLEDWRNNHEHNNSFNNNIDNNPSSNQN